MRTTHGLSLRLTQDAVSRFTLDSATEFLFGKDVNSLDAGLPYPSSYSPSTSVDRKKEVKGFDKTHASNVFSTSFLTALELTAGRTRYGMHWRLREMFGDEVKQRRKAVDEFVNPILDLGAGQKDVSKSERKEEDEETETFLDHLIRYTGGKLSVILRASYANFGDTDKQIIKDELLNILVASRDTVCFLCTPFLLTSRSTVY
jgi:hypothetical protein